MSWLDDAIAQAAAESPMPQAVIPSCVPGRVIQIDGDYLAYFMAGNDETDPGTARRNTMSRIETLREMAGAEKVFVHLTGDGSNKAERYMIATVQPYQGKRTGAKPKNWGSLRELLEGSAGGFKRKVWGDREADDGMACFQQMYRDQGKEELMVTATRDKDMRQYPGWHINWMTYQMTYVPPDAFRVVGEDELLYGPAWFWQQVLMGDAVDCIPGLPKIMGPNGKFKLCGEKTAEKVLENCQCNDEAFIAVVKAYAGFYPDGEWVARLAEQMELLWLRRGTQVDVGDWMKHLDLTPSPLTGALAKAVDELRARLKAARDEVAAYEAKVFAVSSSPA